MTRWTRATPPKPRRSATRFKSFLAEHLPPDWQGIGAMPHDEAIAFTARWRATLHEHGLLGVTWPREYGGAGLTKLEQVVLVEELARAGAAVDGAERHLQHEDGRRPAAAVGHRRAEAYGSCRASSPATTPGARATPSPTTDPTWPVCVPAPRSTVTTG